jgi:hypothetical protein
MKHAIRHLEEEMRALCEARARLEDDPTAGGETLFASLRVLKEINREISEIIEALESLEALQDPRRSCSKAAAA